MLKKMKISSITHRIQRKLAWTKLGMILGYDILLFFILAIGYLGVKEAEVFGKFAWNRERQLIFSEAHSHFSFSDISRLTYLVKEDGIIRIKVNIYHPICQILLMLGIFLLLQILFHLVIGTFGNQYKIRKILSPINDLALQADELSRNVFDDRKFTALENAIENIHPEEEGLLSLGDPDFAGIEAAMNNLLIRMRETNRQQARFVNDASHELRTPISVIKGYANLLARWGKEDENVLEESIHAITNEAEHMSRLVEQLLFLARGDSGRTRLKFETITLNDLLKEIYEESFMIDKDHLYQFFLSETQITVRADITLLKQAVRILIDNAAKYSKKGDEIIIKSGLTDEDRAYIQIQDMGIGMAEQDVKHMFERFYRSDEVRRLDGTGLGLSIAKWIVDMHHGHFEILSRTELGTRIRIVFFS